MPAYLAASWALFLPMAKRAPSNRVIDTERVRPFLYAIPDLSGDPRRAAAALVAAPWLNHNAVQLVVVSSVLLLVGIPFEAREGTGRTVGLFFGTTITGALTASLLLRGLYPKRWNTPFAAKAWGRTWGGASAGAFGLLGAVAARARIPWPLLAMVVVWEAGVVRWYLREYTPVFHLAALLAGFLVTCHALPPRRHDPACGGRGPEAAMSPNRYDKRIGR